MSTNNNEALQAVEEQRMQLERDLQAERSAREAEVTALTVKNSELERQLAEQAETKASLIKRHRLEQDRMTEDHNARTADLLGEVDRLTERATHLAGEITVHTSEANQLRQQLEDVQEDVQEVKKRLEEEEMRSDHLEKRKQDLLQALNEKDRLLRDHRTESELDKATLEKELAEAREKHDALERESAAQIAGLQHGMERVKENLSAQETDNAELQTMCDERGRSISTLLAEAQSSNVKVLTLLELCRVFFSQCESFLVHFIKEEVPKAPVSSTSNTTSRSKAPAATFRPSDYKPFDGSSLERAIDSLESNQSTQLWELAKAQCDHCVSETKNWQKQCRRYKERMDKAVTTSKDKIAFRSFHPNDLALFLPTKNATERVFAAFNLGKPNHFLKPTGKLIEDVESKEWIVARITAISEGVADVSGDIETNPYLLRPGSKYCMLEAEPWPAGLHRRVSRNLSSEKKVTSDYPSTEGSGVKNADVVGTSPDGAFLAAPADLSTSPIDATPTEKQLSGDSDNITSDPKHTATAQSPSAMDTSAFTVVNEEQGSPARAIKPRESLVTSSLSSSRPKDLPIFPDAPLSSVPPIHASKSTNIQVEALDAGGEEPAFLTPLSPGAKAIPLSSAKSSPQVIPRSSLSASRQQNNAFSRSFGSSNGSGGSSGLRNRLSSSSFLTPSKGPATVAASPGGVSSYLSQRSSSSTSPPPVVGASVERNSRYTQTVGRYAGRSSRSQAYGEGQHVRQASASGASLPHSSARDLLRSFTASSSGHGSSGT